MGNWIRHVVEPRRLFLVWQAPDHMGDRFRWVVAIVAPRGADAELRYLGEGAEFESLNAGRAYGQLSKLGYRGYPAFNPKQSVHRSGVLAVLRRRLPPRNRSDFPEYVEGFRLPKDLEVSDLALLALTEAKLPSDGFSIVDPLDPAIEQCDLVLEIAGFRYHVPDGEHRIEPGEPVELSPEPENPHDANAVRVAARGRKVGYINRLQARTFLEWLVDRDVSAEIERVNGKDDRPRAFIFVRIRAQRAAEAA